MELNSDESTIDPNDSDLSRDSNGSNLEKVSGVPNEEHQSIENNFESTDKSDLSKLESADKSDLSKLESADKSDLSKLESEVPVVVPLRQRRGTRLLNTLKRVLSFLFRPFKGKK